MKKIIDYLEEELGAAFEKAGYDRGLAKVTLSNRPDLCEYQCNGAMAGAKTYHKAPLMIAEDVIESLTERKYIGEITAVKPGFINIKLNKQAVASYLNEMRGTEDLGIEKDKETDLKEYQGKLGQIQAVEDALTRVQARKQKAIDSLHRFGFDDARLEIELMKVDLAAMKLDSQDTEVQDDGFLAALNAESGSLWG